MSLEKELRTRPPLDEAISLLYKGRPAKVAMLLGLVPEPVTGDLAKLSFSSGPIPGTEGRLPGTSSFNPLNSPIKGGEGIRFAQGDDQDAQNQLKSPGEVDRKKGPSQALAPSSKLSFLDKRAMTEDELLAYYGSGSDLMGGGGQDSGVSPQALLGLGGGTAAVVGSNRLKTRNVAKRDLKQIRKAYLDAVANKSLSSKALRHLNEELAVRGAKGKLTRASTVGIADANMAKAEKDLSGRLLKARYKGALPLLATTLLGATAYNKLSKE